MVRERESKARQETETADMEQPVSPAGRLFREAHFNCYIVALLGLGAPLDVEAARAGLLDTLVRHPRFSSVQVRLRFPPVGRSIWVSFLFLSCRDRSREGEQSTCPVD